MGRQSKVVWREMTKIQILPDVTLDQELYYKISCERVEGYCLRHLECPFPLKLIFSGSAIARSVLGWKGGFGDLCFGTSCQWAFPIIKVSTEAAGSKPYLIIDGRGCTTEPSLFEHVQASIDSPI